MWTSIVYGLVAMAVLVIHLRVIVYQLAVQCKAKVATRANPDNWKMKVKNLLSASRRLISATCLVDTSVVPVIFPLGYYFPCHLSVFSLKFTIALRHVLLLNLRSHPTRPFFAHRAAILAIKRPGDEA